MPLSRRGFLAGAAAVRLPAQAAAPPNVIVIITDDQGYGDLSLHGNPILQTPNMDSIARQGAQLTRFHVCPVCAPTRASLMTGRYNYRTGAIDTYLGRAMMYPEEVTMAEVLASAGYRTGIFGKWHLGDNYPLRAMDQGFQESLVHTGGGIGQPSDPPGNTYFDPLLQHNGKREKHRGYCTDIFFEAALRFIEENRGRPFFAYIATNAPHTPLQVDDSLVEPFTQARLDETTARVYAMVANIDRNIGRLLAKLKALNLERNTVLIFLTDNGPQQRRYNAGMRGLKGTVYEGGIRVPCFLRWPAVIRAGARIDHIAGHIDLLPTVIEACSLTKPAEVAFDGRSLMPLLRGGTENWPERTLYFQWHRGDEPELYRSCAALTSRYKLVNGAELYNLHNDPAEQHDIAASHPRMVAGLRKRYEEWFRDVSSTRGYAPPRIHLGTPHENPVTLTRQDWRGPRAGWNPDSLGHWEVRVAGTARYAVTFRFAPAPKAGQAHFRLGNLAPERMELIQPGASSVTFGPAELRAGDARLEAILDFGAGNTVGVHYVDVERVA